MFRISDFARLSRVSAKMLRHYDEIGLLKPAWVDPETEYRYYTIDQLPRLNRIIALKDLGFRLNEIVYLLDSDLNADQLRGMLKMRQMEIERQLQEEQSRLSRVEARLMEIERENDPVQYDVVLRPVEAVRVASLRRVVRWENGVESLFDEAERYVGRFGARAAEPPMALYHGCDYNRELMDAEVAIPLVRPVPDTKHVISRELPGESLMACLVHQGGYDTLHRAVEALYRWTNANGYQPAGRSREVYLRFCAGELHHTLPPAFLTRSDAEFMTEIQLPVQNFRS